MYHQPPTSIRPKGITAQAAPVIAAARLRRGAASSAHGAVRLVRDALGTARRAGVTGDILVRADSAYYQHGFVTDVVYPLSLAFPFAARVPQPLVHRPPGYPLLLTGPVALSGVDGSRVYTETVFCCTSLTNSASSSASRYSSTSR